MTRMDTDTLARPAPLVLPCTGQALRSAWQRHDLRALDELTRPLRVAGYRFQPIRLAESLLLHGCASVSDAFGHPVPVAVRVPPREAPPVPRDEAPRFFVTW